MDFHAVTLLTSDLARQYDFYGEQLGLPVRTEEGQLTVQVGSTQLMFAQADAGWNGYYHIAFNIPENQIGEALAWVERFTPLVADANGTTRFDFTSWNADSIYFYDPVGNILECIARHGLANPSDAPFDAQSLLSISEVGIGTDDVRATVAAIERDLGAPVYDGAGSDSFTAIGDEHGLLIVVSEGRIWYPETGVVATAAPVQAVISQGDRRLRLAYPPLEIGPQGAG